MPKSRRSFLKYLSAIPAGIAVASIGTKAMETRNLNKSGRVASDSTDTITLAVTIQGPVASIVEGDDVTIFAPLLDNHVASVGTSANESPLSGNADYELLGLPSPAGESRKIFPPVPCSSQDSYSDARRLRNFTIRMKRPSVLEGIRPVDVMLSDKPAVPANAPMQTVPTGVRFIYQGVPKNAALKLTGPDGFEFAPSFDLDDRSGIRFYQLNFEYQSIQRTDPCHEDATASFLRLLQLFPSSSIRSIKFHNNAAGCPTQAAHLVNAGMRFTQGNEARLMPVYFVGPGDDCQGPNMGSW